MGAPRRLASTLLRAALRLAPPVTRDWAGAMLRELDFIPEEWAALLWSLGSLTAIARHAGRNWRHWIQPNSNQENQMNSKGKKAVGIASGAISAVMLVGCAFALLRIMDLMFPSLNIAQTEWTHWFTVIVIPEAIFIVAAIALWRRRGPVAVGILLTAIAVGLHVVIHVAMH
jgi:hypothetical protein